jgi:hypothetical protein
VNPPPPPFHGGFGGKPDPSANAADALAIKSNTANTNRMVFIVSPRRFDLLQEMSCLGLRIVGKIRLLGKKRLYIIN